MREFRVRQLWAGIRRPLGQAMDALIPHLTEITAAWRNRIASLADARRMQALWRLTLDAHHELLRAGRLDDYAEAIERQAESLARQRVPEEQAVGALAFYLETCLAYLAGENIEIDAARHPALALARLTSGSELLVIAAYARQGRLDREELEQRLRESERRLRNFSMHLIHISEQDRSRLSRDLHDEVGHNLLVLKLYMEMIALDLKEGKTKQVAEKLAEAVELTGQAVEGVRRLAFNLGPAILDEMGFVPSVRRYSRQYTARTGIRVKVQATRIPALPSSYEVAFYRVFQGALSNVAAHARASNVAVQLGQRKDSVFMVVEDDGIGFDLEKVLKQPGQAFGLMAMRQRIELLGGNISAESHMSNGRRRVRSGTRIEVVLPLLEFEGDENGQEDQSADLRRSRSVPRRNQGDPAA